MSMSWGRRKALVANSIIFGMSALAFGAAIAPTAGAQAPASGFAVDYSASANKPVNIEADSLEVDDKKKVAVFKGNVLAVQGDFRLRASEIEVLYTDAKSAGDSKAAKPQPAKDAAASPFPGGNGSIKQINAKGKVLVTGKDNQTATGDWAVFEVDKQLVTLGGDVVVSQGTNTIKGDRLVMDITQGLTHFVNEGTKTVEGDKPKTRLQAIFTPKPRENGGKEKDKAKDKDKAN